MVRRTCPTRSARSVHATRLSRGSPRVASMLVTLARVHPCPVCAYPAPWPAAPLRGVSIQRGAPLRALPPCPYWRLPPTSPLPHSGCCLPHGSNPPSSTPSSISPSPSPTPSSSFPSPPLPAPWTGTAAPSATLLNPKKHPAPTTAVPLATGGGSTDSGSSGGGTVGAAAITSFPALPRFPAWRLSSFSFFDAHSAIPYRERLPAVALAGAAVIDASRDALFRFDAPLATPPRARQAGLLPRPERSATTAAALLGPYVALPAVVQVGAGRGDGAGSGGGGGADAAAARSSCLRAVGLDVADAVGHPRGCTVSRFTAQ